MLQHHHSVNIGSNTSFALQGEIISNSGSELGGSSFCVLSYFCNLNEMDFSLHVNQPWKAELFDFPLSTVAQKLFFLLPLTGGVASSGIISLEDTSIIVPDTYEDSIRAEIFCSNALTKRRSWCTSYAECSDVELGPDELCHVQCLLSIPAMCKQSSFVQIWLGAAF